MFLSVDLLFFGWGKIGEFYVRIFLVFMSIKVFSQVFPFYCLKKSKEVGNDCFFTAIAGRFFCGILSKQTETREHFLREWFFFCFLFIFSLSVILFLTTLHYIFLRIRFKKYLERRFAAALLFSEALFIFCRFFLRQKRFLAISKRFLGFKLFRVFMG